MTTNLSVFCISAILAASHFALPRLFAAATRRDRMLLAAALHGAVFVACWQLAGVALAITVQILAAVLAMIAKALSLHYRMLRDSHRERRCT